jgi:peptide/nickel transport system substrate-binding protein
MRSKDVEHGNVEDEAQVAPSGQGVSRRDFLTKMAAAGLSLPLAGEIFAAGTGRAAAATTRAARSRTSGASATQGIVVGLDSDIDTLDPISFRSDGAYEAVIQVYEEPVDNGVTSLAGINQGVAGTLVPAAASAFSISASDTVYSFTVRPGVKFSNGTPVDANTLKYSYLRALEGPGYAAELMTLLTVTHPDQLVVTGPMSFELRLGQPNPLGPKLVPLSVLVIMDPALSAQYATKKDPWAADYYRTHMMGTGPYVQGTTWQSGNQYLLSPNPLYWNKAKVRNAGVLMKYLPSPDDRALLLQQGSIDVAFGLPASKLNSLRHAPGVRLINVPARNWNYLCVNTTVAPFNNLKVRQAIAYSIPYDALVKDALYGFASPLKGIVSAGTPTLDESLWPYKTDVAKAKALLSAAGYPNGFSTTLSVSVSRADDINAATYVQAALANVGIKATINQLSDAVFLSKQDAGELPMSIYYWYSWVDDPFYQMYWLLNSKLVSATNVAKYSDPTMDALIQSGFYETDAAKRASISQQIQARFAANVPYIPLYSANFTLATGSDVSGVNLYPDSFVRFWDLSKS